MSRGIVFFNHSTKCLARLAVSLWSLRKWYDGPVCVLDTGEGGAAMAAIAAEKRFGVEVKQIPLVRLRRHSCYVTKATLWRHSPFENSVYLDSDTLIVGDLDPLFFWTFSRGLVLTQFSNWIATGKTIRRRIESWKGVKCEGLDVDWLIARSLMEANPCPMAINTGVFGFRRGMPGVEKWLQQWERLTYAGRHLFISDEIAAQILYSGRGDAFTPKVLDDRFNLSPVYGIHRDAAVVHHAHGCKYGRDTVAHLWQAAAAELAAGRVASFQDWGAAEFAGLAGE